MDMDKEDKEKWLVMNILWWQFQFNSKIRFSNFILCNFSVRTLQYLENKKTALKSCS